MFRASRHVIPPLLSLSRTYTKPCIRRMSASLPNIPPEERLTPLVIRITGGNPSKFTLQGTNTYLIGRGPDRILIDAGQGFPIWAETVRNVLKEENAVIKTVLLTHHHLDHVAGLKDVPREHGPVQAWRYPAEPSSELYQNMLKQSLQEWGHEVKALEDGMTFKIPGVDDVVLRTVYAPGHTPDHCVFILEQVGGDGDKGVSPILFSGDAVLGHGTAVFEDLRVYLESLQKMHDLVVGSRSETGKIKIFPAHGQVIDDAAAKLQEYITHRAQREREVVQTLKDNHVKQQEADSTGMLPMEIVKIIYKEYPEPLHVPAEGGLKLILRKLKDEGRVEEEGGRWKLVNESNEDVSSSSL